MIIAFSASLLTPAGYDIVAKKQNLSDAERIDYVNQFQQLIPNVPIQKVAQASVWIRTYFWNDVDIKIAHRRVCNLTLVKRLF